MEEMKLLKKRYNELVILRKKYQEKLDELTLEADNSQNEAEEVVKKLNGVHATIDFIVKRNQFLIEEGMRNKLKSKAINRMK